MPILMAVTRGASSGNGSGTALCAAIRGVRGFFDAEPVVFFMLQAQTVSKFWKEGLPFYNVIVTAGWDIYPLDYDDQLGRMIVTAGWAIYPLGIYDIILVLPPTTGGYS